MTRRIDKRPRSARGVTLVEVVVCVLVVGLLAGAVFVTLGGVHDAAQAKAAAEALRDLDATARVAARDARTELVFDVQRQQVRLVVGGRITQSADLPRAVPLADPTHPRLPYSRLGFPPSFGFRLGDDLHTAGGVGGQWRVNDPIGGGR